MVSSPFSEVYRGGLAGQTAVEEEILRILDERRTDLPDWFDIYNSPWKVKCDCPMPHVQRSGSQGLGLVLDIDLCCLAREVEKLSGKKFYRLWVTKPAFEWNASSIDKTTKQPLGNPVTWMRERFQRFKIPFVEAK